MPTQEELGEALEVLTRFLTSAPLTTTIAELEYSLAGRSQVDLSELLAARGISRELLHAALVARQQFDESMT
jgi:hypothetical protein